MALHKLTHEKAVILDRVLSFLLERDKGGFDELAYGEFLLNDYLDDKPTLRAINADFYITDTLIKDEVSPPYSRNESKFIITTPNTQFFLENGGFTQVVKEQNIQEEYTNQLRLSAIDTNNSIQGLNTKTEIFYNKQTGFNNWQKILTIAIAAFTLAQVGVAVFKEDSKTEIIYQPSLKEVETKLNLLESRTTARASQDSLFHQQVKDSLRISK